MKPHLEEAAAMLRLADRDIAALAVLCRSEEVHLSIICFHAQQAIEKCFKVALFCQLIEFRRTHDLQLLADLLSEHGVRVPLSTGQLAALNPCAVLLRYDDAEIEVANVDRTDLNQMVTSARLWAETVFQAAARRGKLLSVTVRSLDDLRANLSACRHCAEAGYFIGSTPIFTLNAGAVFMTVGQAPGRHEAEVTHLPFSGPAGRRLFRWLAQAGFDEADFRATQAMTAITRCYPGPHPGGRGDRVPTRAEQALCAPWLAQEIALINPRVLIPIGGLAIGKFLGNDSTMTDLIGERFERDGRIIVPLPHPSGASQWFNVPENKARLARALEILAELRVGLLTNDE